MNYKLWTGETGDLHIKLWNAINEYAQSTDDNRTASIMKVEELIGLIAEKQVENSLNELSVMYKAATTEDKQKDCERRKSQVVYNDEKEKLEQAKKEWKDNLSNRVAMIDCLCNGNKPDFPTPEIKEKSSDYMAAFDKPKQTWFSKFINFLFRISPFL